MPDAPAHNDGVDAGRDAWAAAQPACAGQRPVLREGEKGVITAPSICVPVSDFVMARRRRRGTGI